MFVDLAEEGCCCCWRDIGQKLAFYIREGTLWSVESFALMRFGRAETLDLTLRFRKDDHLSTRPTINDRGIASPGALQMNVRQRVPATDLTDRS